MPLYTFWYKKKITAASLALAIKKEPKTPLKLSSIDQDDQPDRDLIPAIGFTVYQDDYEDE